MHKTVQYTSFYRSFFVTFCYIVGGLVYWTVLCYHPYLVFLLFAVPAFSTSCYIFIVSFLLVYIGSPFLQYFRTGTHSVDGAERNTKRGVYNVPFTREAATPDNSGGGVGTGEGLGIASRSIWPQEKHSDLCITEASSCRLIVRCMEREGEEKWVWMYISSIAK